LGLAVADLADQTRTQPGLLVEHGANVGLAVNVSVAGGGSLVTLGAIAPTAVYISVFQQYVLVNAIVSTLCAILCPICAGLGFYLFCGGLTRTEPQNAKMPQLRRPGRRIIPQPPVPDEEAIMLVTGAGGQSAY